MVRKFIDPSGDNKSNKRMRTNDDSWGTSGSGGWAISDTSDSIELYTDASKVRIGAILMQNKHPIC